MCLSHRTSGTPCAGRSPGLSPGKMGGVQGGAVLGVMPVLPLQGAGCEAAAARGGSHGDEDGVQGSGAGGGPAQIPRWVPCGPSACWPMGPGWVGSRSGPGLPVHRNRGSRLLAEAGRNSSGETTPHPRRGRLTGARAPAWTPGVGNAHLPTPGTERCGKMDVGSPWGFFRPLKEGASQGSMDSFLEHSKLRGQALR